MFHSPHDLKPVPPPSVARDQDDNTDDEKDDDVTPRPCVLEPSGQPSPNADPITLPACTAMADKSNKFLTAFHCLQQDERVNIQIDQLC